MKPKEFGERPAFPQGGVYHPDRGVVDLVAAYQDTGGMTILQYAQIHLVAGFVAKGDALAIRSGMLLAEKLVADLALEAS